MRRASISCSAITPRLAPRERRGARVAAAAAGVALLVGALADELPYVAGPLIACGTCLTLWLAGRIVAHHPRRGVANDNDRRPLSYSVRPVLRPVPSAESRLPTHADGIA